MAVLAALASVVTSAQAVSYPLATDWSGTHFFDGWVFNNTYDSLTNGDAIFVNYSYASTHNMAVLDDGQAIIAVDNFTNVPYNIKRDTIKMTSDMQYGIGSVFVLDATHVPYGCSVWPAFWTQGANWPQDGELDIFEGVNLQNANSYAMHTSANSGCMVSDRYTMTGTTDAAQLNCSTTATQTSGCTVQESQANSFGAGFAAAGGGVFAAELATSGVNMWFFPRDTVPLDLSSNASSVNPSTWGSPSANYSNAGCNIVDNFGPQSVILDITLCGDFAGNAAVYNQTCQSTLTATRPNCYTANVIGPGNNYDNAYFSLNYIRVYSSNISSLSSTASSNGTSGSNAGVSGVPSAPSASTKSAGIKLAWSSASIIAMSLCGLAAMYT